MKILHLFDHSIPLHSGYTFRSRAILEAQRACGWETVHLTSPKHYRPGPDPETVDGLKFYRSHARPLPARLPLLNQWEVIHALERRLDRILARERPDLLHAHSPSLNGVAAVRAGRRHGLPVVYECRAFWEDAASDHGTSREGGARYRLTRALETWVFRHADAVTCICEGLRSDILARGLDADKVTVIPNAVDTARFAFAAPKDQALAVELGLKGKRVLGFLGSFYAYEGLELLVEALPRMLRDLPDLHLLLVGGGPREAALRQRVRDLGVSGAVTFTGRVPHDQVARYYGLVDLLVFPRLPMRLTELVTPLKPLEAMAQGKLVLASDVGGHRELIRSGETGWLFRAGDPGALAEAVRRVFSHPGDWDGVRAAGRRFVEEERNWPASVARYAGVYGPLLGRAGP